MKKRPLQHQTNDFNGKSKGESTGNTYNFDRRKRNRQRLGGKGLSLEAFTNAETKRADYNPAIINMLGRKMRDRLRTMDEMLRQAQASMPSGEPRSTPDAAQSSSMAPLSRPSTSHSSPSTLVDASASSTTSAPLSRLTSANTQTGATSMGPSSSRGRGPARGIRTWNSGHPIDVEFDETYHPVGPHARQLINQLRHMVRDPYAFPLTTLDWEVFSVETLDRIWQQVKVII